MAGLVRIEARNNFGDPIELVVSPKNLTKPCVDYHKKKYMEWCDRFYGKVEIPRQFNVQRYRDSEGKFFWLCEFKEEEQTWDTCSCWISGNKVKDIFEGAFVPHIRTWDEDWDLICE